MRPRRCLFAVAALAVILGSLVTPISAEADGQLVSGTCALDLEVSLINTDDLDVKTSSSDLCATTDDGVDASAGFEAVASGTIGYECEGGAGTDASAKFSLTGGGDPYTFPRVEAAIAVRGPAMEIAFQTQGGVQVLAGEGTFVWVGWQDGDCLTSTPVTFTGVLSFVDPAVEQEEQ